MKTKKNHDWRNHEAKEKRKGRNHNGAAIMPPKMICRRRWRTWVYRKGPNGRRNQSTL